MMKNQLAGMMKQVQQMQEKSNQIEKELSTLEIDGQSGAGLVTLTMTCHNEVKKIAIDESLLGDDRDMLEALLIAAFNDALRKAQKISSEKKASVTAGLQLPPGMKLPF